MAKRAQSVLIPSHPWTHVMSPHHNSMLILDGSVDGAEDNAARRECRWSSWRRWIRILHGALLVTNDNEHAFVQKMRKTHEFGQLRAETQSIDKKIVSRAKDFATWTCKNECSNNALPRIREWLRRNGRCISHANMYINENLGGGENDDNNMNSRTEPKQNRLHARKTNLIKNKCSKWSNESDASKRAMKAKLVTRTKTGPGGINPPALISSHMDWTFTFLGDYDANGVCWKWNGEYYRGRWIMKMR